MIEPNRHRIQGEHKTAGFDHPTALSSQVRVWRRRMNEWRQVFPFVILLLTAVACSPIFVPEEVSPSPTLEANEVLPTASIVPTTEVKATTMFFPPTATATATGIPPTPLASPGVPFWSFRMLGSLDGWAWGWPDGNEHLWRTNDGGLTWVDVSPQTMDFAHVGLGGYLDALNVWAAVCSLPDERCGLAHTSDGGETWTVVNDSIRRFFDFDIRFFNERDGMMQSYGVGAGKGTWGLHETSDGGVTWSPIQIVSYPDGMRTPEPGRITTSNICGDVLYIDSDRLIIVHGNLVMDPSEEIHLSITTDRGQVWHNVRLALPPGQFERSWISPRTPVFHSDRDGVLLVELSTEDRSRDGVAFYITTDGGLRWMFQSLVENISHPQFDSYQDDSLHIFLRCGEDLCVSHDGARTWQTLSSNLNFGNSEAQTYVRFFDFGDSMTGWAFVGPYEGERTLWRTTDGGKTWAPLAPVLSP
jgi:hypothetical protein